MTPITPPPTLDQIRAAHAVVREAFAPPPLVPWGPWRATAEYALPTASFKVRGALVAVRRALEAGAAGVVAASAGNHGQGVGWAAQRLGAPATIVVPRDCPAIKLEKMRRYADVIVCEDAGYDAAEVFARRLAEDRGAPFVSPFDDPWVMAGNGGTIALEILDRCPDVSAVVVPVGGGGLFSGLWAAFDALAPHVQLVPVQSEASPAFTRSVAEGRWHATWPPAATLAEGLEGGAGQTSVALAIASGIGGRTVHESSIRDAMLTLHDATGVPIEGSAAVIEAARREGLLDDLDGEVIGILTGGNVAPATLDTLRTAPEPTA